MNAYDFAELFIEDLPDLLKSKQKDHVLFFDINVLQDDPELKILRQELNKLNYDLIPCEDNGWNLMKITK